MAAERVWFVLNRKTSCEGRVTGLFFARHLPPALLTAARNRAKPGRLGCLKCRGVAAAPANLKKARGKPQRPHKIASRRFLRRAGSQIIATQCTRHRAQHAYHLPSHRRRCGIWQAPFGGNHIHQLTGFGSDSAATDGRTPPVQGDSLNLAVARSAFSLMRHVTLFSLDIGTTTCCAVVFEAQVEPHSLSGRVQLQSAQRVYQSPVEFTPLLADDIDEARLFGKVGAWLQAAQVDADTLFGGGVIITGASAKRQNATKVSRALRGILGKVLVHTVDDPCLDAWLAFKGCIAQREPGWVLNLDIGGGTTNAALGRDGDPLATACYHIGARHVQFKPGTYTLTATSAVAQAAMKSLGLYFRPGDTLSAGAARRMARFFAEALRHIWCNQRVPHFLLDVPLAGLPVTSAGLKLHFSGGVGDIIARLQAGETLPTTPYGDLGVEIAEELCHLLAREPMPLVQLPAGAATLARATALGLALHNTEVTSTTAFLSDDARLPLSQVPVLGHWAPALGHKALQALVEQQTQFGGAVHLDLDSHDLPTLKQCAQQLHQALTASANDAALVYLLPHDCAATFGNYLTAWRRLDKRVLVFDNIAYRQAAFLSVGTAQYGVHPVSYFGVPVNRTPAQ